MANSAVKEEIAVKSTAHNSSFNPLNHPISLIYPGRIDVSAWIGHMPFGMYLIDVLRPKAIAELETHSGLSYCAFCQAVREAGGFSPLTKGTFEEALGDFADHTFDLLTFDGFHTYESVKEAFEKWLPKLTDRSVVLFHDINAGEREVGVWRFWEEVKPKFPHFEFVHSHGLGVLAVGKGYPDELNELFQSSVDEATRIRSFFASLGVRLEAVQELQLSRAATSQLLLKTEQQLAEKDQHLQTKDLRIQEMEQSLRTKDLQLEEMNLQLEEMKRSLGIKDLQLEKMNVFLRTKDLHIQEMENGILVHLQSRSYRLGRALTSPLRTVKRLFD
jgi:hypothetical protein